MRRNPDTPRPVCPCDSGLPYAGCCARYHHGLAAPTPEALMRSRYSAYALNLHDYVLQTWHHSTRPEPASLCDEPPATWLGLKIYQAQADTVHFCARLRHGGGRAQRLDETSHFVFENGRWWYVNGVIADEPR